MEHGLKCSILTDFGELEALSADWQRLQSGAGQSEIFQLFPWVRSWWHSLGQGGRLYTPVVWRGDRVVAMLPLVLEQRRLRFLAHSASDYNHFLAEPGDCDAALELCLNSLGERRGDWDEIRLDNVPESSPLDQSLRRLPRDWRRWILRRPGGQCPTLLLGENRQEILKSLLSKESLKRPVRRLRRLGELGFRHVEDTAGIRELFEPFIRQHVRRSAMAGRRSNFLDANYLSFYGRLVDSLDPRSELRFSVLTLDGRPIACHFGTLSGSKYLWYKPAFDVDLWELSPGQALLWHLFDHLRTTDVREFDFGLGDEPFKFRFCNHTRQNLNVAILAPRPRSVPRKLARRAGETGRRWLESSATLYRIARSLHQRWSDLRRVGEHNGRAAAIRQFWRDAVYRNDESWIIRFADMPEPARAQAGMAVRKTGLGELADLSLEFPDTLGAQRLQEARTLLRDGGTAWICARDGADRAVLWTSVDSQWPLASGVMSFPEKTMIVHELWPLNGRAEDVAAIPVLRHFAGMAREAGHAFLAICPRRLLPARPVLREQGVVLSHRLNRIRFLGATRRKSRACA